MAVYINGVEAISSIVQTALDLKANLASPTFTGLVGLPDVQMAAAKTIYLAADNSYMVFRAGSASLGSGGMFEVFGKSHVNAGRWDIKTPNAAGDGDVTRLTIPGNLATVVVTWAASTQTWSSYGAGTLTTDANGVITAVSDARLKNIVGNFSRGLRAILNLSPIEFRWKSTGTDAKGVSLNDDVNIYAGLIAQDVAKYIPEAVGIATDGYYTLSDRVLIVTLINAFKEMQAEIDVLTTKLGLPAYSSSILPDLSESKVIRSVLQS